MHKTLCSWLVAMVAGSALAVAQVATFPLDEVEKGQRGYGLSVFQGSDPERFEFEIIGVWRNVQPGTSYILAEFSGQGLEESGVIAGMSGSPVYIDERLVGAVAFAWPFSKRPIGGITPIDSMRDLLDARPTEPARSRRGSPVDLVDLVSPRADESILVEALERLRPEPVGGGQVGVQWQVAGFGPESRRILETGLGNVSAAGTGRAADSPSDLAPGSSVSGVLVTGDFSIAATGTVTDRIDDRILAFGHAFLGLGSLRLPMATSEVLTVLPNQLSSFKVANLGDVVGAFDFDHSAGFRGRIGAEAPTVPLRIDLLGREPTAIELEIADLPELTATLVAISLLGALEVDPEATGSESMELSVRFGLGELGPLDIRQSFDGPAAALEMVIHVLAVTAYLQQNALGEVEIESVDVDVDWATEPRAVRVRSAFANRTTVRPGEKVQITVDLQAYRGAVFRRELEIELPTDLRPGRFSLLIGDGLSVDAARLSVEPQAPTRIEKAVELLGSLHSRRQLLALGVRPEAGLAIPGAAMPRLPGSVRSLWTAAPNSSVQPLPLAVTWHGQQRLDAPLFGLARVDLLVEPEPVWPGRQEEPNSQGRSE